MKLSENVQYIISRLNSNGYRADVVGGCVRDFLLGKIPNDYDITTSATPEQIKEVFSCDRTVETGIKHGTVTVIVADEPYEITTYRIDGKYSDNRHPDSVSFTQDVKCDLARRDFTVNAMCYNDADGITDFFGGRTDLEERIIRAVGDPETRFSEDALRVLRALRFAAVLDFKIEDKTKSAIYKSKKLLKNVSCERIYAEWKKLIAGSAAYKVLLEYNEIIAEIIPELEVIKLCSETDFSNAAPDLRELMLFALSCPDSKAKSFALAMERLKCDNKHKKQGIAVLENIDTDLESETDIKYMLMNIGEEYTRLVIQLKKLIGKAHCDIEERFDAIIKRGDCYKISDMAIDGNDLSALGISGKDIGEELKRLLALIIEGKAQNKKEELISLVTVGG